ncbi:MAG TPA: LPS assembly lipoprotein LptE [Gallionella sp.]|nr:LPS assembly lipoprotein LptE [Gallionella sp.]
MRARMFVLLTALLLGACGFHLRGQAGMPFATLYLDAPNTSFVADLRRGLEANNVKLLPSPEKADVVLNIVSETPEKRILSLGGSGRVTEYQLRYRVSLRAYDNKQQEWIPAEEMELQRDYSYSDAAILAKESEEAMLYQSMRSDMVQQILRRLSHAKPQPQ